MVRNTYKYYFKVDNLIVYCGLTVNLKRTEIDLKKSGRYTMYNDIKHCWVQGYIVQIGKK